VPSRRSWRTGWRGFRLTLSPTPLCFDGSALHRYPPGLLGISPHRDSARSVNLIAIFVLEGRGRFFVCRDRDGRDAVDLPNAPGDLILLRAPGLMGADVRPFHGVADIAEQRTTFALRQQQGLGLKLNCPPARP
jgi:hypothetical protein